MPFVRTKNVLTLDVLTHYKETKTLTTPEPFIVSFTRRKFKIRKRRSAPRLIRKSFQIRLNNRGYYDESFEKRISGVIFYGS